MKKLLLILTFTVFSSSAVAGTISGGYETVTRYYPWRGDITLFSITSPHVNPAGCSSSAYYGITSDHPELQEYRKLILTALASGRKIGVYLRDDSCTNGFLSVFSIFIDG